MAVEHLCRSHETATLIIDFKRCFLTVSLMAAALLRNNRSSVSSPSSFLAYMPTPLSVSVSSNVNMVIIRLPRDISVVTLHLTIDPDLGS